MNEDQQNNNTQINLGMEQRNAGRDYHEYFMPGSIKLFLATRPKEELDRLALNNPRLFCYRFGFEPPKLVRQRVLEIQNEHDLSDREVRSLRHSGQLSTSRTEATLKPSRLMPIAGWLQLGILCLICIPMALHVANSTAPAWKQMLGLLFVCVFWFGGAWVLNNLYIAPWRILKGSGIVGHIRPTK